MSGLTTKEDGQFQLDTIESQITFAQKLMEQKVISDTFKTPQQVVIGIQFCKALSLNPMTGLKMMYVVHGKPALFGDGPLSLIQSAGKLDWIKEFWVDGDGEEICVKNKNLKATPYAAVCQLKRKDDPNVQEDFFTVEDMALAQLKNNVWNKYQRTMMRYRARTQALKSKFADVLNGVEIAEYVSNDLPKEGVRIDAPVIEMASDEVIENILSMVNETNTDQEKFLEFMGKSNFQEFTMDDAKRAVLALEKKREVQNV